MTNKDLIKQYATTGRGLNKHQFERLREFSNNIFKSYMRTRVIASEQHNVRLEPYEINVLPDDMFVKMMIRNPYYMEKFEINGRYNLDKFVELAGDEGIKKAIDSADEDEDVDRELVSQLALKFSDSAFKEFVLNYRYSIDYSVRKRILQDKELAKEYLMKNVDDRWAFNYNFLEKLEDMLSIGEKLKILATRMKYDDDALFLLKGFSKEQKFGAIKYIVDHTMNPKINLLLKLVPSDKYDEFYQLVKDKKPIVTSLKYTSPHEIDNLIINGKNPKSLYSFFKKFNNDYDIESMDVTFPNYAYPFYLKIFSSQNIIDLIDLFNDNQKYEIVEKLKELAKYKSEKFEEGMNKVSPEVRQYLQNLIKNYS